jgi:putative DNA primase/helicase
MKPPITMAPKVKRPVLEPKTPLRSAYAFLQDQFQYQQHLTLRHQSGMFYAWTPTTSFRPCEDATIRRQLYAFLEQSLTGKSEPFAPNTRKVSDVLDALRAICHVPATCRSPTWLTDTHPEDALDLIPCQNGLLCIPTRQLLPCTPELFALAGIEFAYDPNAPIPHRWLQFLFDLWPNDQEAQETLQEWMGYLLTARTHFQKILLLVGPARSGKGTIGRVIRRLLGAERVCAPTLANLGEQFGLAVLIHKSAALIADARISGRSDIAVIVERLLSISGEDALSIPRKYLVDWTGSLGVRFTIMTNELPRLEDASGALASRFIMLMLQQSFLGNEDHRLFDDLVPELPGIFNWALDGWTRLAMRGHFVQPATSTTVIREFEDLGSPIRAFARDKLTVGQGGMISKPDAFSLWKDWCRETGRDHTGSLHVFAKQLRAAFPWLTSFRPKGSTFEYWQDLQRQ